CRLHSDGYFPTPDRVCSSIIPYGSLLQYPSLAKAAGPLCRMNAGVGFQAGRRAAQSGPGRRTAPVIAIYRQKI
ncbi:MAG TPA: hypothetical protein VGS41_05045, partial [Chthonomonadales bacterium]|nr:hypothetical protein [Chthonomonadales bacterium]